MEEQPLKLKWKLAALCAALALTTGLLTSCSGGDDSGSPSTLPASGSSSASTPAPSAGSSSADASATGAPAPAVQDDEIYYNGVVLSPDGDMAPVLEALGEPDDYSEVISCMFESGMDKTYTYPDLTIYTYPTATEERILLIDVTSPNVQTSRGVKVGDSLDGALLAYTDILTPESDTRYTATIGDKFFSIMGEGGLVTNISYELDKMPIS